MISHNASLIEKVFSDLFLAWDDGGRQLVSLPVRYPSGALATLEIAIGKTHVHVSDLGLGLHEAESLCTETGYNRFATLEAGRNGLRFDGHAITARDIPTAHAAAALTLVANASVNAAAAAIRADADRREAANLNVIFDKVRMAFPSAHIHKTIEISGGKTSWVAHNVVDLRNNRMAVYEPVSRHAISISTKFLMFSDLSDRPDLTLNAVFDGTENLDPKALMLRDVANIISVEDSVDTYRSKAA